MELNQPPVSSQNPDSDPSRQAPGLQEQSVDTANAAAINASIDTQAVYREISKYPFNTDSDYQQGLAAILGHPEYDVTEEELHTNPELVTQAQCFYFSRKFDQHIDPNGYQEWLDQQILVDGSATKTEDQSANTMMNIDHDTDGKTASTMNSTEQPPYPTSFAHIIDLITQNKPIPGIETVPDTVLEPGTSKVNNTSRRKKPWESDVADEQPHKRDEGVLKILQPNAIPDSGLLSRD